MSEFDLRGGQQFSKMSEIQKSLKFPMGGEVKPIWEFFPNFSVFLGARAPLEIARVKKKKKKRRKKFQIAITCSLLLLLAP